MLTKTISCPLDSETSLSLQNFVIQVKLNDEQLLVSLFDLKKGIVYQKRFTENDIGRQISEFMNLEDVFICVKESDSLRKRMYENGDFAIQQSNFNEVIINQENIPLLKIQSDGKISVFKSLVDKRTKKQINLLSNLKLQRIRQMTLFEKQVCQLKSEKRNLQRNIVQNKINYFMQLSELRQKSEKIQKQNQTLQNKIKQLEFENSYKSTELAHLISNKVIHELKLFRPQIIQKSSHSFQKVNSKKNSNSVTLEIFPGVYQNYAQIFDQRFRCSIGRNGVTPAINKREGDGKTPIGKYFLREIWFRADKVPSDIVTKLEATYLKLNPINIYDGWCDEPTSPFYNKRVDLRIFDTTISHEKLHRDDDLYDCFFVVGYNDDPIVPYRGCAIFVHIARINYAGTAGCIAFSKEDLWKIIQSIKLGSIIDINDYS